MDKRISDLFSEREVARVRRYNWFRKLLYESAPLASTSGNCFRQAVRTMDFYLLVVSGVSTLSFCGGEAKRIRVGWIGVGPQSFPWLTTPIPPHTNQRKTGYENHPTTAYSTRTRDRSWTCSPVVVVSPRQETGHLWAWTPSEIARRQGTWMRKISKTAREIWDEQMETHEMALSGEGEYNWWQRADVLVAEIEDTFNGRSPLMSMLSIL